MKTLIFCFALLTLAFQPESCFSHTEQIPDNLKQESRNLPNQKGQADETEMRHHFWIETHFIGVVKAGCFEGLAHVFMEDQGQTYLVAWGTFYVGDCGPDEGGQFGISNIKDDPESPEGLKERLDAHPKLRQQILDCARSL